MDRETHVRRVEEMKIVPVDTHVGRVEGWLVGGAGQEQSRGYV